MIKAYVSRLPHCDFCAEDAKYDFKTNFGPWANGCEKHFQENGGNLGLGKGQELVVGEKPEGDVREEIHSALADGDVDLAMDLVGDGDIAEYL